VAATEEEDLDLAAAAIERHPALECLVRRRDLDLLHRLQIPLTGRHLTLERRFLLRIGGFGNALLE
jgi:hypothetical protein